MNAIEIALDIKRGKLELNRMTVNILTDKLKNLGEYTIIEYKNDIPYIFHIMLLNHLFRFLVDNGHVYYQYGPMRYREISLTNFDTILGNVLSSLI